MSDAVLDPLLRPHPTTSTPFSELPLHQLGGAFARVPADATAFSRRDAGVLCDVIARSPTTAGFDGHAVWARAARREITAHGGGLYVDVTGDAGQDEVRAAYPDAVHRRLVEVKDAYDPARRMCSAPTRTSARRRASRRRAGDPARRTRPRAVPGPHGSGPGTTRAPTAHPDRARHGAGRPHRAGTRGRFSGAGRVARHRGGWSGPRSWSPSCCFILS
ncbi:hypothetical protein GTY75_29265 [Streptomyces sp. SID8381]|uniref:hypothetical protein n=1 Tax=unclassified Streptomyces TaxID=2593676 RepID=UPI00048823B1|nr:MULTISPECIES: hypothetical protein [unclassified Streptomyces]MYX30667.1 hypothetical protein [Streptomyces sp. SID8381]